MLEKIPVEPWWKYPLEPHWKYPLWMMIPHLQFLFENHQPIIIYLLCATLILHSSTFLIGMLYGMKSNTFEKCR